jgi:hypothetical protein
MGIFTKQSQELGVIAETDLARQEKEKQRIAEEQKLQEERIREDQQRREEEQLRTERKRQLQQEIGSLEKSLSVSTFGSVLNIVSIIMIFTLFLNTIVFHKNPLTDPSGRIYFGIVILFVIYLITVLTRRSSTKRKIVALKRILEQENY